MRALFVSDIHANLRLSYAKVDEGNLSSDRLRDVMSILEQVGNYACSVDAGAIFILGDLFDQKTPDGATLVHTARALQRLASDVPTYVLPGNHDAIDRDGRMYNLQMYAELEVPGLHVLGHETIELEPGLLIHAVPWLPEARAAKRIRAREKGLTQGDRHLLVFHQGILGALWDSGRRSDDGMDGLVAEAFDLALTGHYHRPQLFESGRYLGAPMDMRFGDEAADTRGFLDVDLTADKLAPIVVPTKYPRFHTATVDLGESGNLDTVASYSNRVGNPVEAGAKYLRVIVEGSRAAIDQNRKALQAWRETAIAAGARMVKIDPRPHQEVRQRLDVEPALSLKEMARRYADKFAPEGMDPKELARQGAAFVEGL